MTKKSKDFEFENGWENYRDSVIVNMNKSQDDFEKYINLLASGGIIISLTFLEKIVSVTKISYLGLYIIGLFLLVMTLLSNLYSHFKSMRDSATIIKEIDEKKYDEIFKNIEKRNKPINLLNKASIWFLIIGAVLILTFTSINLLNMNSDQTPQPKDSTSLPDPNTGRVNPSPKPIIKPKTKN
ncbi:hypothetical protein M0M57_08880 [Flavobacterium azooxidireducens]|uniref:DUF202 domain-containing protein n=1 Tax=Flavobacterium azooxidireducens TaxID=1871076 RepID=A0ABY4KAC5_9FLAO|nr:hypothetical protein [Flavobacterium azooxidireducens]UPQ77746.1 hypothetical protein M0M57_08880 [Flavobacterium azooxidireducens]